MMKRRLLCALLASVLAQPLTVRADLPDLGEISDASLSLSDESRIGRDALRAMREAGDVLDDAEISAYLNDIGGKLSSSVTLPGIHFTYFCVADTGINAFAMPGGYIGVNIGLILATQSEGELAAVMGHETAHVAQRHIARMQAANSATSPLLLLGTIIAAALAAKAGSGDGAMGAVSAGMGLSISRQLAFSRDFEREADRVGMQFMSNAGYDVRYMATFFQRLEQAGRYSDTMAYAFLRTHPVTVERISEAQNRALDYPVRMRADSIDYLLVREKLRTLTMTPEEALFYYNSTLQRGLYLNEGASWYGLARAKLLQHDRKGAEEALAKARAKLPDNPMLHGLEVEIARDGRDWSAAAAAARDGLAAFPRNVALQLAQIDVALDSGDRAGAQKLLRQQLNDRSGDPALYRREAKLYADRDPLRYHEALGNAFYYEQRYSSALEQYQLASKAKGDDFYLRSMLEARLREVEKLAKDERKAARN
ncbi:M48 family metalloprotease [Chromobacterium subtsugae]|uniref:M48 family metalloprotease n=1 Tax=Chromobacterium subtsugae TaxID=251747 RepID=UPI000A3F34F3|nr:M48 family metalloprotease [Chromobacterium subtsugae]